MEKDYTLINSIRIFEKGVCGSGIKIDEFLEAERSKIIKMGKV